MPRKEKIHCPNCGSFADKEYLTNNNTNQITETSCPVCDYFMVSCNRTGRVVEAYAPGISPLNTKPGKHAIGHKQHQLLVPESSER